MILSAPPVRVRMNFNIPQGIVLQMGRLIWDRSISLFPLRKKVDLLTHICCNWRWRVLLVASTLIVLLWQPYEERLRIRLNVSGELTLTWLRIPMLLIHSWSLRWQNRNDSSLAHSLNYHSTWFWCSLTHSSHIAIESSSYKRIMIVGYSTTANSNVQRSNSFWWLKTNIRLDSEASLKLLSRLAELSPTLLILLSRIEFNWHVLYFEILIACVFTEPLIQVYYSGVKLQCFAIFTQGEILEDDGCSFAALEFVDERVCPDKCPQTRISIGMLGKCSGGQSTFMTMVPGSYL